MLALLFKAPDSLARDLTPMWSDSELTVNPLTADLFSLLVSTGTSTQCVHIYAHSLGACVCEHTHTEESLESYKRGGKKIVGVRGYRGYQENKAFQIS